MLAIASSPTPSVDRMVKLAGRMKKMRSGKIACTTLSVECTVHRPSQISWNACEILDASAAQPVMHLDFRYFNTGMLHVLVARDEFRVATTRRCIR